MQVVKKRTAKTSQLRLLASLRRLIALLERQNETEAVADLNIALIDLEKHVLGSSEHKAALQLVAEAFTGEHELEVYMNVQTKENSSWGAKEELYLTSTEVFSLVKRMLQG